MKKVVAVDNTLSEVKSFLSQKGCYVVDAQEVNKEKVDAFVISGNTNLSQSQEAMSKSMIINAGGKTPEQVWSEIQQQ